MVDPMKVHQDLLDRSGAAMLSGSFPEFRDIFVLPTEIETFEIKLTIVTEADLRVLFDRMLRHHEEERVTDIVRRCLSAECQDDRTIWATHETRYIHHGTLLKRAPHAGFSVLNRDRAGHWRVSRSQYAVDGSNALNRALRQRCSSAL